MTISIRSVYDAIRKKGWRPPVPNFPITGNEYMDGSQDLRSRPDAGKIADLLEGLDDLPFGGKPKGRFRISRKFLRMFAGRRRLPSELVSAIADEMFERGYVMIDMETYFVVIPQRYFSSYRRVTAAVVAKALPVGPMQMDGDAETDAERDD